jgi:hypothetical protein
MEKGLLGETCKPLPEEPISQMPSCMTTAFRQMPMRIQPVVRADTAPPERHVVVYKRGKSGYLESTIAHASVLWSSADPCPAARDQENSTKPCAPQASQMDLLLSRCHAARQAVAVACKSSRRSPEKTPLCASTAVHL